MEITGYPRERVHLVKGMVEDTLPPGARGPRAAAAGHRLVCLDEARARATLSPPANGGVLIIDDYGHYEGARRAVDEYFAERASRSC